MCIGCLAAVVLLAGCGGGGGIAAVPASGIPNQLGNQPSAVFFIKDGRLWPSARWGMNARPQLREELRALMQGPTAAERAAGVTSLIPPGTHVLGLKLDDTGISPSGRRIINLSSPFAAAGATRQMQLRLAQVVFTLGTTVEDYPGVSIQIDGRPETVATPDGGYKQWVTRQDFATLMPAGWVPAQPRIGGRITSDTHVFGYFGTGPLRGHTAEVSVWVRVVNLHGRVLASAEGGGSSAVGNCCGSDYRLSIPTVSRPTRALFQVIIAPSWWPAHKHLADSYPIWIVPPGGRP